MAKGARISDTDRGYRALVAKLKETGETVQVGIFEAEGAVQEGDTSVKEIAERHEFGIGVPRRSWLLGWLAEDETRATKFVKQQMEAVVQGAFSLSVALDRVGLWSVGRIQQRIARRIAPANAPSTIARKGSDVPLIDTGQLRSSVSHKVSK